MYHYFATLLNYPDADVFHSLDEAIQALAPESPESAALLERFRGSAVSLGQGALEERYIETFEVQAESALYVGHQIFAEDWRRGIFMAGLRERYRPLGILEGTELPDHLTMVLRYVEVQEAGPEKDELIGDCVVPAVRKVLQAIEGKIPYCDVLNALLLYVQPRSSESELEETSCRPSSSSLFPILH